MPFETTKEQSREVKNRLSKLFGKQNVIVRKGRGTASGWIETRVFVSPPSQCFCQKFREEEGFGYCFNCKQKMNSVSQIIKEKTADIPFYTYCPDDGYNSESKCFLIQVDLIN